MNIYILCLFRTKLTCSLSSYSPHLNSVQDLLGGSLDQVLCQTEQGIPRGVRQHIHDTGRLNDVNVNEPVSARPASRTYFLGLDQPSSLFTKSSCLLRADLVYGKGESEQRAWKRSLQLMLRTSGTRKGIYPSNEATAWKGKRMQKAALRFTSTQENSLKWEKGLGCPN